MRTRDFLRFGGFDEHSSFTVVNCGLYDLAWRLRNAGIEEHWHPREFVLHTHHPWFSESEDNWGPHCMIMASLSLKHIFDG